MLYWHAANILEPCILL